MESRLETLKQERAKIAELEEEVGNEMLQRLEKALSTVGFDLARRKYRFQVGGFKWELGPIDRNDNWDYIDVIVCSQDGKVKLDGRPLV